MISINELIQQAYTRCGLVGEGQAVNGTKAMSALHELNDLIQILNQQEYISDNLRVFDIRKADTITIGNGPVAYQVGFAQGCGTFRDPDSVKPRSPEFYRQGPSCDSVHLQCRL